MANTPPLSWKWILIGAGMIAAINLILRTALAQTMAAAYLEGDMAMLYVWVAVIAAGSFGVGGLLTGWFSPGETVKEPAIASAIAVLLNAAENYAVSSVYEGFSLGGWAVGTAIMVVIGFGLGMAGGWIGEKIQGDSTEKMRERGELPPS